MLTVVRAQVLSRRLYKRADDDGLYALSSLPRVLDARSHDAFPESMKIIFPDHPFRFIQPAAAAACSAG